MAGVSTGVDAAGAGAGGINSGAGEAGGDDFDAGSGGSRFGTSLVTPVNWKVLAETEDSNLAAGTPSAASRGEDAAVAYLERADLSASAQARILMQRFDANGDLVGSPIVLETDVDARSNVTLASDGQRYAACWHTATAIHCCSVDDVGEVQPSTLAIAGQYATLVARASGWALAYRGSDQHARVQALTPKLELSGREVALELFAEFSSREVGPLFASTPTGYVVVGSSEENGDAKLLRLDSDMKTVLSVSPLARNLWFTGQLIASDSRVAVSLSAPYGSYLQLLQQDQLTAELPISGGGKTGMDSALLLTEGGVAAAWLDPNGDVRRRFFADGHDAEIGLENRESSASLIGSHDEGSESYQQLLKVGGRTLLVARAYRYGILKGSPIRVAPLRFP